MDSVTQSGLVLTSVGAVGFILIFTTSGLNEMFDLWGGVAYGSPLIATLFAGFCLVFGIGALTGVMPDGWFTGSSE